MNQESTTSTTDTAELDLSRVPMWCPTWCTDGHVASVRECGPGGLQDHGSDDHVGGLPRLSVPATGAVIRPGGGGWRAELRAADTLGWQGQPFLRLELWLSNGDDFRELAIDFTPGESLEMAHVMTTLAQTALTAGSKRTERPEEPA